MPEGRHLFGLTPGPQALLGVVVATTDARLINQPDQTKGFFENIERGIHISIPAPAAGGILADKHSISERDIFPAPATLVTQLAGWKEAIHLHHLTAAMRYFAF